MGKHFTIDADFWTNAAVADSFSAEEKFLYLFLCTNKHLSMCGCCEISTRTIAIETGLEGYMVERALSRLQKVHGEVVLPSIGAEASTTKRSCMSTSTRNKG